MLSAFSDALVALRRISAFLTAEELAEPYLIEYGDDMKDAVRVDGSFVWETAGRLEEPKFAGVGGGGPGGKGAKGTDKGGNKAKEQAKKNRKAEKDGELLPTTAPASVEGEGSTVEGDEAKKKEDEEKPFELKNLKFSVPKGAFVAIVGRVGCGKVRCFFFSFPL